jgi:hypothetical protein
MLRPIAVIIVFVSLWIESSAQNAAWLHGRVTNEGSGKPIPFVSVQVKGRNIGVISNGDGDFQIPKHYKDVLDTLLFSCIGFESRIVPLATFQDDTIFSIKLKESLTELSTVDITSKRQKLSARNIVKAALENLSYNCSASPLVYEGYYRDYQVEDSSYVNLNEAVVQIEDSGFSTNDQLTTKIRLLKYVANQDFKRDTASAIAYDNVENKFIPGARLGTFGGNELMILRVHDPIRNSEIFSFSFVGRLNHDFIKNHFFRLEKNTVRNDIPLYRIYFGALKSIVGDSHFVERRIYIEPGNFAIHKVEYATYEKMENKKELLYDVQLEYSRVGNTMHPNYISFNNRFKIRNPLDFRVTAIEVIPELNMFLLHVNHDIDPNSVNERTMPGSDQQRRVTGGQAYVMTFEGKRLSIGGAEVSGKRKIYIKLNLNDHYSINEIDEKLIEALRLSFSDAKDTEGRRLNVKRYITINQFREFFVQRTNISETIMKNAVYLNPGIPLVNQKPELMDALDYWMNTPLKKKTSGISNKSEQATR